MLMEQGVIRVFIPAQAIFILSDSVGIDQCSVLLSVLCSAFVSLLKHDMCEGTAYHSHSITDMVNRAFSVADNNIKLCFSSFCVGGNISSRSLRESLYYVAGWHASTIQKISGR